MQIVLLSVIPVALALRKTRTQHDSTADSEICVGCEKYPEAADFEDDWREQLGIQETIRVIKEIQASDQASDEERITALKSQWEMAMHVIFTTLQHQDCRDVCAICGPSEDELRAQGDFKLKSVSVTRARNWQASALMPVTVPVDTILGGVAGAAVALPAALISFLVGGTATGIITGGAFAANAHNITGSFAGNILGTLAGIAIGTMSGTAYAAVVEILGLSVGLFKGISPVKFACKRVGFEVWSEGQQFSQKFASKTMNPEYGLKRLRQWMNETAPADVTQGQVATEAQIEDLTQWDADNQSVSHCERLRDNKFDMRHASQCLKHSQLCGKGTTLLLPVSSPEQCRQMSDMSYLEGVAIAWGDDPDEGLFATWRKYQERIKDEWGYDGKRKQCIALLCEYDGFRKASLKLHPDKVNNMDLSPEEKLALVNIYKFLVQCKTEYQDVDGGDLMLNKAAERAEICPARS